VIGQTLLEKMDLLVDCNRQRLVPAHPEGAVNKAQVASIVVVTNCNCCSGGL